MRARARATYQIAFGEVVDCWAADESLPQPRLRPKLTLIKGGK
jgi:hypothetical protein